MVKGLDRLRRKLRALPQVALKEVGKANDRSGAEMVALAKSLAPKDDGVLAGTIRHSSDPATARTVVEAGGAATTKPVREGADAEYDYALGQEFGTEKMPANPFFFPAWRAVRKPAKARARRAMTKAAKAVAAGGR